MALVSSIEPIRKDHQTVHQPTRCLSSIVEGPSGERYIQLDTYGSAERQQPEKISCQQALLPAVVPCPAL